MKRPKSKRRRPNHPVEPHNRGTPPPNVPLVPENETAKQNEGRKSDQGKIITRLQEMPSSALVDEAALAHTLGVSKRTVRRMVARYELPPPVRLAGRSTWQAGKVVSWFEQRAERLAREAERHAKKVRRFS